MSGQEPECLDFRDAVFGSVHAIMRADPNAVCLTNDMGAMGLDIIRAAFPERILNVGIAEQNMMSVAGGLALSGKSVFVYGIVAHVTARCFEQIKLDICVPDLPVTIIGVGAGLAYGVDGPTHHGVEDIAIMRSLGNMHIYNPADCICAAASVTLAHAAGRPAYVRMDKELLPALYDADHDFTTGYGILSDGMDVAIVSTGVLSWTARSVASALADVGVGVRVIDLYRLRPVDGAKLATLLSCVRAVVTLEENVSSGGVGSLVAEALADSGYHPALRRISLGDCFLLGSASRGWAAEQFGLTQERVMATVRDTLAGAP